jgi:hypothetical protein
MPRSMEEDAFCRDAMELSSQTGISFCSPYLHSFGLWLLNKTLFPGEIKLDRAAELEFKPFNQSFGV